MAVQLNVRSSNEYQVVKRLKIASHSQGITFPYRLQLLKGMWLIARLGLEVSVIARDMAERVSRAWSLCLACHVLCPITDYRGYRHTVHSHFMLFFCTFSRGTQILHASTD